MTIETASPTIERAIDILRTSGQHNAADDLQAEYVKLKIPAESDAARSEILSMCHMKWLGDVLIEGIEYSDWTHVLGDIYRALAPPKNTRAK